MQLTNILRDVGEDLRRGRVYLPASWLAAYGLGEADLRAMMAAGRVSPAYAEMVEALLQVAEQDYDDAFPAIRRLPGFYWHAPVIRAKGGTIRFMAHPILVYDPATLPRERIEELAGEEVAVAAVLAAVAQAAALRTCVPARSDTHSGTGTSARSTPP